MKNCGWLLLFLKNLTIQIIDSMRKIQQTFSQTIKELLLMLKLKVLEDSPSSISRKFCYTYLLTGLHIAPLKGEHLVSTWVPETSTPDSIFTTNTSGWTNSFHGMQWIQHFNAPTKSWLTFEDECRLLLCNGHDSYISAASAAYCLHRTCAAPSAFFTPFAATGRRRFFTLEDGYLPTSNLPLSQWFSSHSKGWMVATLFQGARCFYHRKEHSFCMARSGTVPREHDPRSSSIAGLATPSFPCGPPNYHPHLNLHSSCTHQLPSWTINAAICEPKSSFQPYFKQHPLQSHNTCLSFKWNCGKITNGSHDFEEGIDWDKSRSLQKEEASSLKETYSQRKGNNFHRRTSKRTCRGGESGKRWKKKRGKNAKAQKAITGEE